MSYHKIVVVGNLGKSDPEMRYTPGGQAVTNFSVASNRQYAAANGEKVKETVWFRVSAWGKQAEICNQYLKSGQQVMIEGRLTPDKDTGGPRVYARQDGTSAASYEITAERVVFLGGGGVSTPRGETFPLPNDEANDEFPF